MRSMRGVTLLELVIGLLISTMITGVLMNLFNSSLRSLRRVTETAEKDQNLTVVLHQLSYDLQGAVMPALRPTETTEAPKPGETEPQKPKPLAQAFVATEKNKRFEQLTFVTTNPRTRFVTPLPQSFPKPQLVRVTYQLRGTSLFRSETTELTEQKKKAPQLLLSDDVKTFSLSFKYTVTAEKKVEVKTETAWSSDQSFAKDGKLPPLPAAVVVTLAKGDYYFPIPCYEQAIAVKTPPPQPQQQQPGPGQQPQRPPFPRMKFGKLPRPTFLDKYFGKPT